MVVRPAAAPTPIREPIRELPPPHARHATPAVRSASEAASHRVASSLSSLVIRDQHPPSSPPRDTTQLPHPFHDTCHSCQIREVAKAARAASATPEKLEYRDNSLDPQPGEDSAPGGDNRSNKQEGMKRPEFGRRSWQFSAEKAMQLDVTRAVSC